MINNKSVLAIIPARGGSRGVPRKNIKELAGKPLIAWTIEEAKKSKYIDRLILSSEDKEIIEIAKSYGCEVPFTRPEELALDETPGIEPVLHALKHVTGYDYVVLLQPTSPLRKVQDIDVAIEKSDRTGGIAVVSVTETDKSPYWMYNLGNNEFMTPIMNYDEIPHRRQEAPIAFALNGAVYVSNIDALTKEKSFLQKETIGFVMSREKSLDIDSELDFKICEVIIKSS
jgi:CMP-N,N'-diacetyllegionaminic acid synthase